MMLFYGCSLKYIGPQIVKEGVRFSVDIQNAGQVTIAGSFNQWDTERDLLTDPDENGIWSITLPLADGRYEYLFFVDDSQWQLDPDSPAVDDGWGNLNSVVLVRH